MSGWNFKTGNRLLSLKDFAEMDQQVIDQVVAGLTPSLSLLFMAGGAGGSGFHVDLTRPVFPAQRLKQELINVTVPGDLIITLGAAPINGVVAVWVKTGSAAPARLLPGSYSVTGNTLVTVSALLSGDKVLIEYFYDSDVIAEPAAATTNQYDLYDTFTRTVAAGAASALGAALTGQTPAGFGSATWGVNGTQLYKAAPGSTAAQDCVYWTCTAVDGWLETVYGSNGVAATSQNGLALRGNTSTTRLHTLKDGFGYRVSGTDTRILTSTESFAPGDGCGVLAAGKTFKLYRRAANAGPWNLIGTATLPDAIATANPTLLTSMSHGVRQSSVVGSEVFFDYIKFIAGAVAPPAVT